MRSKSRARKMSSGRHFWTPHDKIGKDRKWRKHPKGGGFRKWSGNIEWVVDWSPEAKEHYKKDKIARTLPERCWDLTGICWSEISNELPSFRKVEVDEIVNNKALCLFPHDEQNLKFILGYLNSKVTAHILQSLSPTFDFLVGDVQAVPMPDRLFNVKNQVEALVDEALEIAKYDWSLKETSLEFPCSHLVTSSTEQQNIRKCLETLQDRSAKQRKRLFFLESEINRLFIEACGLQDELSPEVPEDQITLYRPDREEDIKRLISYAIGCMMGRYSLEKPVLIYAHSGNHGFWNIYHEKHERNEKDKTGVFSYDSCIPWSTFPPDDDGIIPITDDDWFPDDAANRVEAFIATAWPKGHLDENLKFIAESLSPNRNEQPRETIRRYLATGFFKHHLSMYKRRPIYWLFSSGKQRAFQCLVYLHRYNEGTLSRMRTEYVIPLQGKIASRIGQLDDDITAATSTSHRKRLEKERDKLLKQQAELQTFDEQLRHYADRRISLDLDDGVKVNYGKFGDLLAEVKAVTGGTDGS